MSLGFNDSIDLTDQGFDEDGDYPPKPKSLLDLPFDRRNARYNEAYGNYRGGYGPGGGYGPRPMFPSSPMPPRPWGGSYGPGGPPFRKQYGNAHPAIKYLIRCGATKESLKGLPRDLLDLMEPEHCRLCAIPLDSFTMSKMHYICKNHQKNIKKYLGLKHNNKESMPLKARELYCELCDVQMTSKTHSDAHYAGKPHTSIVLGRKNPKNPILLQNGMRNRLNQLIAREKKFINKVTQAKPEEEAAAPKPKEEKKPVPPELYCEICKTGVTCTEQMTMHMNGKRHLSKEKQYILRQMKGEPENTANAEKKDETTEEDWEEPWGEDNGEGAQQDADQDAYQDAEHDPDQEQEGAQTDS